MSLWATPMDAAKMAVKPPMAATISRGVLVWPPSLAASNSGNMRATRKTPAATIVAAWIMADTGVGPAIASGSQTWSGNWADLPTAPMNSSSEMSVRAGMATPKAGMVWSNRVNAGEPRTMSNWRRRLTTSVEKIS